MTCRNNARPFDFAQGRLLRLRSGQAGAADRLAEVEVAIHQVRNHGEKNLCGLGFAEKATH